MSRGPYRKTLLVADAVLAVIPREKALRKTWRDISVEAYAHILSNLGYYIENPLFRDLVEGHAHLKWLSPDRIYGLCTARGSGNARAAKYIRRVHGVEIGWDTKGVWVTTDPDEVTENYEALEGIHRGVGKAFTDRMQLSLDAGIAHAGRGLRTVTFALPSHILDE